MPEATTNTLQKALEKRARAKVEKMYEELCAKIKDTPGMSKVLSGFYVKDGDNNISIANALWNTNGKLCKMGIELALPEFVEAETRDMMNRLDAVQDLIESQQ